MRKIKYKAWDNDLELMADVLAIDWTETGDIISLHLKYEEKLTNRIDDDLIRKVYPEKDYGDDITLLQYIGINDVDDKEIYEGYVVRCWGGEHCQGYWEFDETITVDSINNPFTILNLTESENIEIIGNIYENPDLLK